MGNIKKQPKVKKPVRIRFKRLKDGSQSIYLDTYDSGKQKHKYEFLKLYIVPERSRADKDRNRTTLEFARTIQAQRIVELQADTHGLSNTGKPEAKNVTL